jgi:hypothetical protein
MSDQTSNVITVVSALIGAIIGSIGATFTSHLLSNRAERQRIHRNIVQRYLIQLQFSLELLSSRFHNFDMRRTIMTEEYFQTTTLYALGRVLAYKQILDMEAAGYSMVPRDALKALDEKLDDLNYKMNTSLFRYDRQTLAETLMEKEEEHFRVGKKEKSRGSILLQAGIAV